MSGDGGLPWARRWAGGLARGGRPEEAEGHGSARGILPFSLRSVRISAVLALLATVFLWFWFGSATYTPSELAAARKAQALLRESGDGPFPTAGNGKDRAVAAKADLERERRRLQAALAAHRPRGAYIVVDRGNNRIFLRKGDSLLMEGVISTGSGAILQETTGQKRQWVFDTPPGRFTILSERPDPVWTKPDWAFLEEGKPIPTRLSERREYGSLGEYALDLGDGYMIHGTLYERLLGRSVTHGCVRVGREDLRTLVRHTGPGSQVFIF